MLFRKMFNYSYGKETKVPILSYKREIGQILIWKNWKMFIIQNTSSNKIEI